MQLMFEQQTKGQTPGVCAHESSRSSSWTRHRGRCLAVGVGSGFDSITCSTKTHCKCSGRSVPARIAVLCLVFGLCFTAGPVAAGRQLGTESTQNQLVTTEDDSTQQGNLLWQHSSSSSRVDPFSIDGTDPAAVAAAAAGMASAANSSSQSARMLLSDLHMPESGAVVARTGQVVAAGSHRVHGTPRLLAGAPASQQQPLASSGGPLCSATINYGASVGDVTKKSTAEVPIFVGSFDIVVTHGMPEPKDNDRWALGWHFTAGEHLQFERDVFGDDGIYSVYLSSISDEAAAAPGMDEQGIAVFSNTSLSGPQSEITFSFVGRKGVIGDPTAPFRVAPPSHLFLNNHYCWPLLRPSTGDSAAAGDGSGHSTADGFTSVPADTLGRGAHQGALLPFTTQGAAVPAGAAAAPAGDQQQWVTVAQPALPADKMPKQLLVEYLPVEFADEEPALFAKTLTQFYVKVSNAQAASAAPVYLDQVLLQYWFHGPQETSFSDNSTDGSIDAAMALAASQFKMSCSDATPDIGCDGIFWNVTAGLPGVFGARFILNVWFPPRATGAAPTRVQLLPPNRTADSAGGTLTQLHAVEAILVLDYRRFFATINARDDYSFLETPLAPGTNMSSSSSSSSSASSSAKPIRRVREPNKRLPAFLNNQLAWGSPPEPGRRVPVTSRTNNTLPYPPGSYCQKSTDGGMICGVDMLYCCLGTGQLSNSIPLDWKQRLFAGANSSNGTNSTGDSAVPVPGSIDNAAQRQGGVQGYVIALSVAVPVLALGSALALFALLRWAKKEIRRNTSNGSSGSADGSFIGGTGDPSRDPYGGSTNSSTPFQPHESTGRHAGVRGSWPTLLSSLLAPWNSCYDRSDGGDSGRALLGHNTNWFCWKGTSSVTTVLPVSSTAAAAVVAANGAGAAGDKLQLSNVIVANGLQQQPTQKKHVQLVVPDDTDQAAAGNDQQQQLAPWQQQEQIPQWQQLLYPFLECSQVASSVLSPEQVTFVFQQPPAQRLWRIRQRGNTLPADVMASAIQQYHLLQRHQLQGADATESLAPAGSYVGISGRPSEAPHSSDDSSIVYGTAAGAVAAAAGQPRSIWASGPEQADVHDKRWETWGGRLNEDAFGEDVLGNLLDMQLGRQLNMLKESSFVGDVAPGVSLQPHQQQSMLPQSQQQSGAAAAAAVEAAIAAINAAIARSDRQSSAGSATSPKRQQQQRQGLGPPGLLTIPSSASYVSTLESLIPSPSNGGPNSAPSFYKALMASGGVLNPPGGPPIPLNVDFAVEIQPYLGRLLGKGGFGHVYEGLWRGQQVAVKLLSVDTDDPVVLDAFLKEVALCACLRGCDKVVRLLGACLGGMGSSSTAAAGSSLQSTPVRARGGAAAARAANGSYYAAGLSSDGCQRSGGLSQEVHVGTNHSSYIQPDSNSSSNSSQMPMTCQMGLDSTPFERGVPESVMSSMQQTLGPGGNGQQSQQLALIMELVEGGNLAQRIYNPSKRRLTYMEILQVGLDVTSGLAYLHPAVVHRDLKPQNVLLDRNGRAKIADFGISRFKDPTRSYLSVTHQGGTPNYMAPELFNGTRVDEAADVYSLGCILYECLARRQPFGHLAGDGKSFNVLFKIIVAVAINKERPALPADTPPRLASLISRCWCEYPDRRPRVQELAVQLQSMMQEELQANAVKLSRLRRLSSRSRSLPTSDIGKPWLSSSSSSSSRIKAGIMTGSRGSRSSSNMQVVSEDEADDQQHAMQASRAVSMPPEGGLPLDGSGLLVQTDSAGSSNSKSSSSIDGGAAPVGVCSSSDGPSAIASSGNGSSSSSQVDGSQAGSSPFAVFASGKSEQRWPSGQQQQQQGLLGPPASADSYGSSSARYCTASGNIRHPPWHGAVAAGNEVQGVVAHLVDAAGSSSNLADAVSAQPVQRSSASSFQSAVSQCAAASAAGARATSSQLCDSLIALNAQDSGTPAASAAIVDVSPKGSGHDIGAAADAVSSGTGLRLPRGLPNLLPHSQHSPSQQQPDRHAAVAACNGIGSSNEGPALVPRASTGPMTPVATDRRPELCTSGSGGEPRVLFDSSSHCVTNAVQPLKPRPIAALSAAHERFAPAAGAAASPWGQQQTQTGNAADATVVGDMSTAGLSPTSPANSSNRGCNTIAQQQQSSKQQQELLLQNPWPMVPGARLDSQQPLGAIAESTGTGTSHLQSSNTQFVSASSSLLLNATNEGLVSVAAVTGPAATALGMAAAPVQGGIARLQLDSSSGDAIGCSVELPVNKRVTFAPVATTLGM